LTKAPLGGGPLESSRREGWFFGLYPKCVRFFCLLLRAVSPAYAPIP
jgi:hypothetical protein